MIISVCGNICSGKSTTAKLIQEYMNFTYIPYERPELMVLDKFYDNITEMFLATQSSFIISKSQQILNRKMGNLVVDRGLYEDINIFAKYWLDNYSIREMDKHVYLQLAELIVSLVPQTDIEIFCDCSTSRLIERYNSRPRRSFEKKYPKNYISNLNELYKKDKYFEKCFRLDMDKFDLKCKDTQIELIEDINLIVQNHYFKLKILEHPKYYE